MSSAKENASIDGHALRAYLRATMHRRYERLAEMLAAADPPAAVDLLLRLLCECHDATGGAALVVSTGLPIAQAVRSVDPRRLAAACEVWNARQEDFRRGSALVRDDHALLPLRSEDELVGLLYLEAPQQVEPEGMGALLAALATALRRVVGGWDIISRPDERTLLRRVLQQCEWNISRTARAMGVTRRTVYQRMRRFGIPRRKASTT